MDIKFKIRAAKKGDLNEIVKIFISEFAKYPYNEKWREKEAFAKIKGYFKGCKFFVAEIDGKIAGFIIGDKYYQVEKKLWIYELVVSEKFQGRGIGKALIDAMTKYFKKEKIGGIRLIASKKAKAFKFYKKLNFKETGFVELEKKL